MNIESALKTIGDWISKETESRKYPKGELLEISESLQTLKTEIARQSVKSEDVQRAIEYLEPLTEHPTLTGQFAKHLKTILTALQAYQPWIPVSERMAIESDLRNGMVLAWSTELCEWQVENWGYAEDRPDDYTHWKPLPEPPKGE